MTSSTSCVGPFPLTVRALDCYETKEGVITIELPITLSETAAVALIILPLFFTLVQSIRNDKNEQFWASQPRVGPGKGPLALTRATLASLWATKTWAFDGYSKYSKDNGFFVMPALDRGRVLVLPPKQVKKVYSLPESMLDVTTTGNNSIQTKWTIWDEEVSENPIHMHVIRNQLTRNLDILTPVIAEELERGFMREWGTSKTEWKTISTWASALHIVAGAANSAFCGQPLCRDMAFLQRLQEHAMCLFLGSVFINITPKPFRFLTGLFIGWTSYFLFLRVLTTCLPYVKERINNTAKLRADSAYQWTPPKDGLQWIIEECFETGDPDQLNPRRVAHRLCFMNDISMHSTGYTARNVIIDLASADPSLGYLEALREEAGRVLKEAGGVWTRQAALKLKLMDSTVRESMRLSTFFSVGLPRTVVDPHGISVHHGNSTVKVPVGTVVAIPVEPIHYDDAIYPDARSFKPFRFTDPASFHDIVDETVAATKEGADTREEKEKEKEKKEAMPKASATIDEGFLSFGFGKHACPGRFFALNEVKVMIAHMILNYDVELLRPSDKNRSKNMPMIWLNVPLMFETKVKVRKRDPVEAT